MQNNSLSQWDVDLRVARRHWRPLDCVMAYLASGTTYLPAHPLILNHAASVSIWLACRMWHHATGMYMVVHGCDAEGGMRCKASALRTVAHPIECTGHLQ